MSRKTLMDVFGIVTSLDRADKKEAVENNRDVDTSLADKTMVLREDRMLKRDSIVNLWEPMGADLVVYSAAWYR